jgi:hypothetical protein
MTTATISLDQRRRGRRARLWVITGLCALYPLCMAGNAAADDAVAAPDGSGQSAATQQGAAANGVATQSGPINVVVSVRVDSPGNSGPISQSNVAVVNVGAGNDSATSQSGADELNGGQQAVTGQEAVASGDGAQSQPTNLVVSIRINSPGNDGPVSQTNLVAVGVSAGNASLTTQIGGSAGPDRAPRTALPMAHSLRHGAAPAEAADTSTVTHDRRPAPRRSAPAPHSAEGQAVKSLGRPVSGAAAAQSAGFPAAAARASDSKPLASRLVESASSLQNAATSVLGRVARLPSTPPEAVQRAGRPDLLTLTAIALLAGLLVWASSTWLGGLARPVRTAWGLRP